jgi:putative membrane protein
VTGHGDIPVGGAVPGAVFWLLTILIIAGVGYATGVQRLRSRGDKWPRRRSLAVTGGLLCLAAVVLQVPWSGTAFPQHVIEHLLLGMLGPLLLALSAPMTLALRTLPTVGRRHLLVTLQHPVARVLTLSPVVLLLHVGGLYAYYVTPLYDAAHHQTWMQVLIHTHMFLTGCLLSWYLIGPDPLAHRPNTRTALVVLLIAAVGHDILAKLLYAKKIPSSGGTPEQIQLGAQIMYYGGSFIEILLAAIVMTNWYTRRGRILRREHHRAQSAHQRRQQRERRSNTLRQDSAEPDSP